MIVAAVPVKRLSDAKSRLRSVVAPEERRGIVLELVGRTISVLRASGLFGSIVIVTPEVGLGESLGVQTLPDDGDLNASLVSAVDWASRRDARALLILPADLPLIERDDLHALLIARAPGIGIAPTADGGTGALYLSPPDAIRPAFGPDSFQKHLEAARAAGRDVRIVRREGLSFDLDTAADLERWRRMGKLPITGLS